MKIKLLKELPLSEVGQIFTTSETHFRVEHTSEHGITTIIPYTAEELIHSGYAEQVKDTQYWIPDYGEICFTVKDGWIRKIKVSESFTKEFIENISLTGLLFKTEEEAKKRLLFLELSNSNCGFVPKEGEDYWSIYPPSGVAGCYNNRDSAYGFDISYVMVGNCYRTAEQAIKYAHKWKEYFDLLKN